MMILLINQITLTTIGFLEFESFIELKIENPNHDSIRIPNIKLCQYISSAENYFYLNKSREDSFEVKSEYLFIILTSQSLNNLKKHMTCQLFIQINKNSNGQSIDCDQAIHSIEKEIRFMNWNDEVYLDKCSELIFNNEKLIQNKLIRTNNDYFIKYSINQSSFSSTETKYLDHNFWYEISGKTSESKNNRIEQNMKGTIMASITKTSQILLESPYKSRCSRYERDMPYGSISYTDCLRKCFIESCNQLNKCFYFGYQSMIKESDFKHRNQSVICNETQTSDCLKNINQSFCQNSCPIDCIKDKYGTTTIFEAKDYRSYKNTNTYLRWDSEKPFITYKETPNMLLIDYFTFIGGLFGFWFGVSLNNLFELFLKNFKALKSYTKIVLKFLQLLIIKMCEKILLILIGITYFIYSLINNLFITFKNNIYNFRNP